MEPNIEKTFEFIVCWKRWTVGVHWDIMKNSDGFYRLEISVQIPVIALSIIITNY